MSGAAMIAAPKIPTGDGKIAGSEARMARTSEFQIDETALPTGAAERITFRATPEGDYVTIDFNPVRIPDLQAATAAFGGISSMLKYLERAVNRDRLAREKARARGADVVKPILNKLVKVFTIKHKRPPTDTELERLRARAAQLAAELG